jgi:hypothetical protein
MLSAMTLRGLIDEPACALTIYTRFAHPPSALFIGYMKTELDAIGGSPAGTLGWTHIADGKIMPFFDVDCDKIREVMTSTLATTRLTVALRYS